MFRMDRPQNFSKKGVSAWEWFRKNKLCLELEKVKNLSQRGGGFDHKWLHWSSAFIQRPLQLTSHPPVYWWQRATMQVLKALKLQFTLHPTKVSEHWIKQHTDNSGFLKASPVIGLKMWPPKCAACFLQTHFYKKKKGQLNAWCSIIYIIAVCTLCAELLKYHNVNAAITRSFCCLQSYTSLFVWRVFSSSYKEIFTIFLGEKTTSRIKLSSRLWH